MACSINFLWIEENRRKIVAKNYITIFYPHYDTQPLSEIRTPKKEVN